MIAPVRTAGEAMASRLKAPGAIAAASIAAWLVSMSMTHAAEGAPTGAWRTVNECFLAMFLLTPDGAARTIYMTGEADNSALWTWDGMTLRIVSRTFDLDKFTARFTNDRVEADYVWHDNDKNELHTQSCTFERYTDLGI
jgi:hypothetical protein